MLAVHDCCHIIVDMYAFPKLIILFFNNQDVAALKFARKTVHHFQSFGSVPPHTSKLHVN